LKFSIAFHAAAGQLFALSLGRSAGGTGFKGFDRLVVRMKNKNLCLRADSIMATNRRPKIWPGEKTVIGPGMTVEFCSSC